MTAFPKPAPKAKRARKPLARRTRVNQKRAKPRRGPPRDPAYRVAVRGLAKCCAPSLLTGTGTAWYCEGPFEASHTGEDKGGSMKASDYSCVCKCRKHHRHWDGRSGVFAGWSRERRQEWAAAVVAETQARLGLTREAE